MIKKRDNKGFTLLEIAICIVIIGVISAAAVPKVLSMFEDGDAEMLRALGSEVQVAIGQGISRGKTYTQLIDCTDPTGYLFKITELAKDTQGGNVAITCTGPTFSATLPGANRSAVYGISNNLKVTISSISGFNHYTVSSGDIVKN